MAYCSSCDLASAGPICPKCGTGDTSIVGKTLDVIAYTFVGAMLLRLVLGIGIIGFASPFGFGAGLIFIAIVLPVGLAGLVWYFARKARQGDADALRWLKVVIVIIGVCGLFGIGTVLSPLLTLAFCGVAFGFLMTQSFGSAFDAINRAKSSYY